MITVVIKDGGEPNVIAMTQEILERELQDVAGSLVIVEEDWLDAVPMIKSSFVSFVEADCLISSGYYSSMIGILSKDAGLRKLGIFGGATGVQHWGNRFFGYSFNDVLPDLITADKQPAANTIYPIQFAYVPGAIIRTKMLKRALDKFEAEALKVQSEDTTLAEADLVDFSVTLSTLFWMLGPGHRVAINPNATYVTTEEYVQHSMDVEADTTELGLIFKKAGI